MAAGLCKCACGGADATKTLATRDARDSPGDPAPARHTTVEMASSDGSSRRCTCELAPMTDREVVQRVAASRSFASHITCRSERRAGGRSCNTSHSKWQPSGVGVDGWNKTACWFYAGLRDSVRVCMRADRSRLWHTHVCGRACGIIAASRAVSAARCTICGWREPQQAQPPCGRARYDQIPPWMWAGMLSRRSYCHTTVESLESSVGVVGVVGGGVVGGGGLFENGEERLVLRDAEVALGWLLWRPFDECL